ncbi:MAG: TonB-dependent receptor [Dysgonamonadaceae bacterium]|jgi:TonB-linked SusC/RagA family outer membrane protein|nr:TonB-dependent receptor [Dysgonamonadaceae bacterium]
MMQKTKQKVSFATLVLSLFVFCSAYAQQKTISGVVTEAGSGEPVIGASVAINNTSVGTATDLNGKFSLTVPANGTTLVVSYIGFLTQELPIDKTEFSIVLKESATDLDELVVIGYGSVRKKDLTGSVSMIKGDVLVQMPVANAVEAMTGRLAGVRITATDGSPDAEIMIRVRGGGSITGDNSPLYIVDGFPVSSFGDIPAGDIADISVLKDASSTAIYGAQGANGVVLITTKRAQTGKTQVSYNGFMQSKRLSKRLDVLDPFEYVLWNYEMAAINGESDVNNFQKKFGFYEDMDLYKYQRGTDWQDDMFGSSVISQQQNISISGGTEKTKYLISGTYNKDGGLMPYTNFSRYNLNFKLDQAIANNLHFQFDARTTDTQTNGDGSAGGTNKIRTFEALTRGPVKGLQDLVTIDPNLMTEDERDQWIQDNMSMAERAYQYWRHRESRVFAYNAALNWDIIKGLNYRLEGGYTYGFNEDQSYKGYTTVDAANNGGKPLVSWTKTNTQTWRVANILNYNFTLADNHRFNLMGGQEVTSSGNNSNGMTVKGFNKDLTPEKIFANIALGDGGSEVRSSESEPHHMASFFGRAGYNFKDRYLATFTLRADASSKFKSGKQWGYFPSAALAWRVNEESFMANTQDWLSNLKLRLSYGEAGNNRISSGLYKLDYKISSSGTYAIGDIPNNYYVTSNSQLPNPDVRWEAMITRNAGLDFGLFNQRLSGTLEYYWNSSKDLLLDVKITAPGYSSMVKNIGQTTNRGVELTLDASIIERKNFTLGANFNIGVNKSNVDALDSEGNFLSYSTNWASTDLKGYNEYEIRVGQPVGLIYGWVTDGYYTTSDFDRYDEATKKYIPKDNVPTTALTAGKIGIRPGTIKFKDLSGPNGVPDEVIDDYDRTVIGNANPDFTGGFGFNGTVFKNFDYLLNFSFVVGNDIYNANKLASSQQYRTSYPNVLGIFSSDNRYSYLNLADGTVVTDLETLAQMNEGANAKEYWSPLSFGNSNAVIHSWAIEDGSFLRLQNVTLGYTLPQKFSQKFSCQRFRAYCTLNNLWVWTNYSGYDPEVSSAGRGSTSKQLIPGLDYSAYPKSFSWTVGLNVTF